MNKQAGIYVTMAQAVIAFLKNQYVERDGVSQPFFAGCFGIFGHGNVGGIGQALQQMPEFRYYQARNEQAMVHAAAAYAKVKNRLQTFACTSSIGPGATNMVTGAALATINRLPVLLLPGDIFARRNVAPVLQQLESEHSQDISVNDAFKPVSRYWDRISRPEQLLTALPEAVRVLTSPEETGAVTLALPQDVQAEAWEYPAAFFSRRVWHIPRNRPDRHALEQAAALIRASKRPMIIAGGGVLYAEATEALQQFVNQTGIPVGETMAGKGSLTYDHPLSLGAIGATGTFAANHIARDADLVIGIGTRYSDFTTSSKTAFQAPHVRFININVAEFDAAKHAALALTGDARAALEELLPLLNSYHVAASYRAQAEQLHAAWDAEVERIYAIRHELLPSQGELIGAVNELSSPDAIMLCAAGSLPGDLHKLWRARHPKNYHLEYGYSCMGYEIAGGLGAKMAAPERDVYVMVGDGSYLMMNSEIVTSIQEGYKLIIVLLDNQGFKSIGSLSRSLGQDGFGTRYVYPQNGILPSDAAGKDVQTLPVDLAANARSLGAHVIACSTYNEFVAALKAVQATDHTSVIYIQNDRYEAVPSYDSWWDVPVAAVSTMPQVQEAHAEWVAMRTQERYFLGPEEQAEIRLANAPCSWGALEFDDVKGEGIPYGQMLDELRATGYIGTELGNLGYMPAEPSALREELARRDLAMVGAFMPVALKNPDAHAAGEAHAVKVARLLASVVDSGQSDALPVIILADDNGIDPLRTRFAGRITSAMGLNAAGWETFAHGAERIAHAVRSATGLPVAFHHHCAGYVETPEEIARLLDLTDSDLVGLVFDTGHYLYGTGKNDGQLVLEGLRRFGERIRHVHFKDCQPQVAEQARHEGWDYFTALQHGVFCELGRGAVPFAGVLASLYGRNYRGWIVVEQDILPGMGSPRESAERNRSYLHSIGL